MREIPSDVMQLPDGLPWYAYVIPPALVIICSFLTWYFTIGVHKRNGNGGNPHRGKVEYAILGGSIVDVRVAERQSEILEKIMANTEASSRSSSTISLDLQKIAKILAKQEHRAEVDREVREVLRQRRLDDAERR